METYLIIGAARSGLASGHFLLEQKKTVYLSDMNIALADKVKAEFPELDEKFFIFGEQPDPVQLGVDEIIVSPGIPLTIPPLKAAAEHGIPVIGEVELAYQNCQAPMIGITGTNGKTTTTSLIGHLVKSDSYRSVVGGNIGDPLINQVTTLTDKDVVVAELSSFQLETIETFRPKIAIMLNLTPDHLDRHKTMDNYLAAKARIFENQNAEDYLILNQDDQAFLPLAEKAKSQVYWISQTGEVPRGMYEKDGAMWFKDADKDLKIIDRNEIGIVGNHNFENAMASALAAYLFGVPVANIVAGLKSFKGVAHRMEFIRDFENIRYINDSKGTNPDATLKALASYEAPIVLIAGGKNKGSSFDELALAIKPTCRHVCLVGEAAKTVAESLKKAGYESFTFYDTFADCVRGAREHAQSGDVVLLSPACASWDMFNSFEERGDLFRKLVMEFEQ